MSVSIKLPSWIESEGKTTGGIPIFTVYKNEVFDKIHDHLAEVYEENAAGYEENYKLLCAKREEKAALESQESKGSSTKSKIDKIDAEIKSLCLKESLTFFINDEKAARGLTVQQVNAIKRSLRLFIAEKFGNCIIHFKSCKIDLGEPLRDMDENKRAEVEKYLESKKRKYMIKKPGSNGMECLPDISVGEVLPMQEVYPTIKALLEKDFSVE